MSSQHHFLLHAAEGICVLTLLCDYLWGFDRTDCLFHISTDPTERFLLGDNVALI